MNVTNGTNGTPWDYGAGDNDYAKTSAIYCPLHIYNRFWITIQKVGNN